MLTTGRPITCVNGFFGELVGANSGTSQTCIGGASPHRQARIRSGTGLGCVSSIVTGTCPPPTLPPPSQGSLRVPGFRGAFSRVDRALSALRLLGRGGRSSRKGLMPPSGHGQSLGGCASFHTCSGFTQARRAAQYLSAGGL